MAVNTTSAGNYLSRVGPTLASGSVITIAGWIKRASDRNDFSSPFGLIDEGGSQYAFMQSKSDGDDIIFVANGAFVDGPLVANGDWWYLVGVLDLTPGNSRLDMYWAEAGDTSFSTDGVTLPGAITPTHLVILDDFFSEWWPGAVASVGIWTKRLSQAEREAQLVTLEPAVTDSLWGFWKLTDTATATVDASGNGRSLSVTGTLGQEAGPTLGGGATSVAGSHRSSTKTFAAGHAKPVVAGSHRASTKSLLAGAAKAIVAGAHRGSTRVLASGSVHASITGAHRGSTRQQFAGVVSSTLAGAHRVSALQLFAPRRVDYMTGVHRPSALQAFGGAVAPRVAGAHLSSGLELYPGVMNSLLGATRSSTWQGFGGAIRPIVSGAHRTATFQPYAGQAITSVSGAPRPSALALGVGTATVVVRGSHRPSTLAVGAGTLRPTVAGATRGTAFQAFAPRVALVHPVAGATRPSTFQCFTGDIVVGDVSGAHRASTATWRSGAVSLTIWGGHRPSGLVCLPGFVGDRDDARLGDDLFIVGRR